MFVRWLRAIGSIGVTGINRICPLFDNTCQQVYNNQRVEEFPAGRGIFATTLEVPNYGDFFFWDHLKSKLKNEPSLVYRQVLLPGSLQFDVADLCLAQPREFCCLRRPSQNQSFVSLNCGLDYGIMVAISYDITRATGPGPVMSREKESLHIFA
jgi:hypothetical protein